MGRAIAVRTDFTAEEVRRSAKRAKDAAQARRLLAIAAVLDGASREDAAKIGGMDRQTLRDWVIRFNEQGPDGLINIPSPGVPPKLGKKHRAFLARLVEQGPIPAVDGVVRWRACDLIMRLHEEFGLSVSDDTIYRALKDLGFSHVSARPKAYKQDPDAVAAFNVWPAPSARVLVSHFDAVFNAVCKTRKSSDSGDKLVHILITEEADACLAAAPVLNLENKIVLAVGTRRAAERYMIGKIEEDKFVAGITTNQTQVLIGRFKEKFSKEVETINILDRVGLMTPENIHVNSFMYEPIVDMSDEHLKRLYNDVKKL
jgi:putative transposase